MCAFFETVFGGLGLGPLVLTTRLLVYLLQLNIIQLK